MAFKNHTPRAICLRVPQYLYDALQGAAKKNQLPMNQVVIQYLKYLESRDRRYVKVLDEKQATKFRITPKDDGSLRGTTSSNEELPHSEIVQP